VKALSLQRLEIFEAIYEVNSISEAARRLGLAQPTVSRHLRYFEQALQLELFVTERGRLKPTWEAHRLYEECQGTFERVRQVEEAISALQQGQREHFRIMTRPSFATAAVVPEAVKSVLASRPNLRVTVDVGTSSVQLQALRNGNTDIGVAGALPPIPDMTLEPIGRSELMALVATDHPLAEASSFPLSALAAYPCILLSTNDPIGKLFHETVERQNIVPNEIITAGSPLVIPPMVETLGWCAIVDRLTVHTMGQPKLRIMPLEHKIGYDIQVIRNESSARRKVAEVFIQSLKEEIRRLNSTVT
jgi:DNA-binding transcriptional LysR family regulator